METVISSSNEFGDQGDGTYRNPVLYADYSDPDVIRVDDTFYLTASSFNAIPGLPLLKSHDLVNWSPLGYALQRFPHPNVRNTVKASGRRPSATMTSPSGFFSGRRTKAYTLSRHGTRPVCGRNRSVSRRGGG